MKTPIDPLLPFSLVWIPLLAACSSSPQGGSAALEPASQTPDAEPESPPGPQDESAADEPERWNQAELEQAAAAVQADIEKLRGEHFKGPVPVRVASKAELIEYMKKREALTETPEKIAADEVIAKLLGVIPADMDLYATVSRVLESQVGGFYDPETDSFALMDGVPKGIGKVILAHELGHALDDQLYDIDGRLETLEGNGDAMLAYHAVVEGSGTSVMTRWMLENTGEVDLAGFSELQAESSESLVDVPAWIWKPLIAVYLSGAAFLARTDNVMGGQIKGAKNEDVERAFREPPRSMEQVLHPAKYWSAAKLDEPVAVRLELVDLPDGWTELRQDVLGESLLAIMTSSSADRGGLAGDAQAMLALKYTNAAAGGWGGDRVILLGNGEARYLRLVTRWDTERDAGEFFGVVDGMLPELSDAASALAQGIEGAEDDFAVEVAYGTDPRDVVLTASFGVEKRDLRKLDKAVRYSIAAD